MASNPTVTDTQAKADTQPGTMDWALYVKTTKSKDEKTGTETEEQSLASFVYTKESDLQKYKDNGTLVGTQTIGFPVAQTFKGIADVLPDEEQACAAFFAGCKSSLIGPRFRRLIEAFTIDNETKQIVPSFNFVDGIYDVLDLMREDAKRKVLSPQEKIIKNLRGIPGFENLPEAVLLGMYENMKASLPQSMVADIEAPEPTEATV
jgi:hypothetical protein